jgi:hypothetical protein
VEHLCRIKLEKRAKLNGIFMCSCWHTRGNCFADCNNKASHVPCSKPSGREGEVLAVDEEGPPQGLEGLGCGLVVHDPDPC